MLTSEESYFCYISNMKTISGDLINLTEFENGYIIFVAGGYTYVFRNSVDEWRSLVSEAEKCVPGMCAELLLKSDCVMYANSEDPEFSVIKDKAGGSSANHMGSYDAFDTFYRMGKAGVHPMSVDRGEVDLAYWKAAEKEARRVICGYVDLLQISGSKIN